MTERYKTNLIDPSEASVLDVPDVIELERKIEAQGVSLLTLMRRAGNAVADFVCERFPQPCRVLIACGSGNNGGDGWVCAETLSERGYDVRVLTPLAPRDISAHPAREAAEQAESALPAESVVVHPSTSLSNDLARRAQVVVDAMLGTGFSHNAVREPLATWINACNAARIETGTFIVSVDVPSGMSAQTGAAAQPCIVADATITMLAAKPGLVTEQGRHRCGETFVAKIH